MEHGSSVGLRHRWLPRVHSQSWPSGSARHSSSCRLCQACCFLHRPGTASYMILYWRSSLPWTLAPMHPGGGRAGEPWGEPLVLPFDLDAVASVEAGYRTRGGRRRGHEPAQSGMMLLNAPAGRVTSCCFTSTMRSFAAAVMRTGSFPEARYLERSKETFLSTQP